MMFGMKFSWKSAIRVLAVISLGFCAAGCYSRVVKAGGISGAYANVEPEYRSNTAADRLVDRLTSSPKSANGAERWVDDGSMDPGKR